jgi:hypothetical protein
MLKEHNSGHLIDNRTGPARLFSAGSQCSMRGHRRETLVNQPDRKLGNRRKFVSEIHGVIG